MTSRARRVGVRMRRILQRASVYVLTLGLGVVLGFLGLTRTQAGQALVVNEVLSRIEGGIDGRIAWSSVSSDRGLHRQATLRDVEILDRAGSRVFRADSLQTSYTVRELIGGDLVFRDVEVWGPVVRLTRAAPGEPFTIVQALRGRADTLPVDTTAAEPRRIAFDGLTVHDGRVELRDPLPRGRDPGRIRAERVLGREGWVRSLDFDAIDARLGAVTVEDPEVDGIEVEVEALAMEAGVYDEPTVVRDLAGRVSVQDRRMIVAATRVRLPAGTDAAGTATLDWETGFTEVSMNLTAPELATADFGWVLPEWPVATGGTSFFLERTAEALRMRFEGGSLDFGDGTVSGDGELVWSPGDRLPRLSEVALELGDLPAPVVEGLVGVDVPFGGAFGGDVRLDGPLDGPIVRGTLLHTRDDLQPSTIDVRGRLLLGDDPGGNGLVLDLRPLSLGIVQAWVGGMDSERSLRGRVQLDGRLSTGLTLGVDVTYPSPRGDASSVSLAGSLTRAEELVIDLDGSANPVSFPALVGDDSPLSGLGEATGSLSLQGPFSALKLTVDLETRGGNMVVESRFDGRNPSTEYSVHAEADGFDPLTLVPSLPEGTEFSGEVDLVGRGGTLDEAEISATARLRNSKFARLAVDSARFEGVVSDGLIRIDEFTGRIGRTDVVGSGTLGASRATPGRLDVSFETDDLEGIRPYFLGENVIARDTLRALPREILILDGVDPDTLPLLEDVRMGGSARANVSFAGSLDSLAVSGDLSMRDAVYGKSTVEQAAVEFDATGLPSVRPRINALVETGAVRLFERSFDSASVRLDYREPRGRSDVFLVRAEDEDYRAHVAFEWSDSVRIINLDEMTLRFPDERWNLGGPATVSWDPDGLTFRSLRLIRPGADGFRLRAEGRYPFRGDANLDLSVEKLDLERLAHLLQIEETVEGTVNFDVEVLGTARAPEIEGAADVTEFHFREYDVPRIEADLEYAEGRLDVDAEVRSRREQVLMVRGELPANLALTGVEGSRFPDESVDVTMRADSLPLALLMAPFDNYRDVRGSLTGEVALRGTLESLAPDGDLRLEDAGAYVDDLGVLYDSVQARVRLNPDGTADVTGSAAARGRAELSGVVTLSPATDPTLDLRLDLDGFQAMERRDLVARLDGTVAIDGSYRAPVVSGDLSVSDGTLYIEEFVLAASVLDFADLSLDPEDETVGELLARENPFLRNVVMRDLTLTMANNNWARSDDLQMEVGGELEVFYDRSAQDLALVGELDALRGTYTAFSRGFNIRRGTMRFLGTPGFNPDLDIEATNRLRTQDREPLTVTVNVTGTLLDPVLDYTSDQAGLTRDDILSYMYFGRPSYGLTSGQTATLGAASTLLVGRGVTLGLQTFSSALQPAAAELGLAYLSFTQQDVATLGSSAFRGSIETAILETGAYVSDNFFLTLLLRPLSSQGAGSTFAGLRLEWTASDLFTFEAAIEEQFFRSRVIGFGELGFQNELGFGLFVFREWGY